MNSLNELLQELGISKVRLAKYLNVSRQMVYNYLELDDLNKWPKEKKILLLKLLDIEDGSEDAISGIKITTDYLMAVENRLNQGVKNTNDLDSYFDMKGLDKESQTLLADINYLLKEKLLDENKKEEKENIIRIDNIELNETNGIVKKDGKEIELTALEYKILVMLFENRGRVISREQILANIWDESGNFVNDNTLTVYIKRLRAKIENDTDNPNIIKTIRRLGYKIGN